ncbi:hypothetical protein SDC9_144445 [bioreactor metagenome]|uniref:Uncharacterized protein n=1 Tax=bioreactor metagenome TaxID=1076179 RepID=A0A645E9G4_9ZZZZ
MSMPRSPSVPTTIGNCNSCSPILSVANSPVDETSFCIILPHPEILFTGVFCPARIYNIVRQPVNSNRQAVFYRVIAEKYRNSTPKAGNAAKTAAAFPAFGRFFLTGGNGRMFTPAAWHTRIRSPPVSSDRPRRRGAGRVRDDTALRGKTLRDRTAAHCTPRL